MTPGVYEPVASAALVATEADAVLLLITNGVRGDGCSVCIDGTFDRAEVREQLTMLVAALKRLSAEMEEQIEALKDG